MLLCWNNGFLRPLIQLGVWMFGNNENEVLTLDNEGERLVDAYGSEGSPFARLLPDLHGGDHTAGLEGDTWRAGRRKREGHTHRVLNRTAAKNGADMWAGEDTESEEADINSSSTYLCTTTLRLILEYRLESAPLPLAVAAASPRLRFLGEQTSIFYFPGAACCVRAAPTSSSSIAVTAPSSISTDVCLSTLWQSSPSTQAHVSHTSMHRYMLMSGGSSYCDASPQYTRKVRGTSLASLTRSMRCSAWWYGRATPAGLQTEDAVFSHAKEDAPHDDALPEWEKGELTGGADNALVSAPQGQYYACLPLCVEVVAPRVAEPAPAPPARVASRPCALWTAGMWGWMLHPLSAALHMELRSESRTASCLAPIDAELQITVHRFVALVDQLWCERRCALVELAMERFPLALTEWMLSPDLHATSVQPGALNGDAERSDVSALNESYASVVRVRRAFRHIHMLKCRGRVAQASAGAMHAVTAVARGAAPLRALSASSADVARLLPLSFTSVQPHLRVLDLSGSAVASLDGLEAFPLLEKVVLTGCVRLESLSPLGLVPSLREIVASQSGIYDVDGLARSSTLVTLSLYGCLNLTDVGACGRIPTLRDLFISESTVEMLEGLQESRSLVRLGMRYCDVLVLAALSSVSSLRILHASSSTLTSVAALQYCVSLEVVEVAACAQLVDLGPLGLAPRLLELDASGSGVRRIDGLRHSTSLEKLLLAQCIYLEDIDHLGQCVHLRQLSLTGARIRSLDGLAGAPALMWLDVSFCRQLSSFSVLLQLPQLHQVLVGGCTEALRRPDDVQGIVSNLRARRKKVMVIQ
ncbi:hypothetical protein ABL78_5880 [Leptomonas seymouri]|uniref:Leucine-rich repeat protein (LRRP) n=1 Tax=Leptomonas seymouri TaxID=5684 RepID=A0A0N1PBC4_LEPSE|nr:hypothetical protein ABL78_5880 [Leptomonas seymouri]|eukprot:KPI85075.1 hypothetical protein ABL78_5880 [Leptomonas seymouri]